MADTPVNGVLVYGSPYTVPAGKMLFVRMLGAPGPAQKTNFMQAGSVTKPLASDAVAQNDGLFVNELTAIVPAGGVLAVNNNSGNPANASYSGILRDV